MSSGKIILETYDVAQDPGYLSDLDSLIASICYGVELVLLEGTCGVAS